MTTGYLRAVRLERDQVADFGVYPSSLASNAEGGSKNFRFGTRRSESPLHQFMRPVRGARRRNVATEVERLGVIDSYGGVSLHEQSHHRLVEEQASQFVIATYPGALIYRLGPDGIEKVAYEDTRAPQRHARLLELAGALLQAAVPPLERIS